MPDTTFRANATVYAVTIAHRAPPTIVAGHPTALVYADQAEAFAVALALNAGLGLSDTRLYPFRVVAVSVCPAPRAVVDMTALLAESAPPSPRSTGPDCRAFCRALITARDATDMVEFYRVVGRIMQALEATEKGADNATS